MFSVYFIFLYDGLVRSAQMISRQTETAHDTSPMAMTVIFHLVSLVASNIKKILREIMYIKIANYNNSNVIFFSENHILATNPNQC